jgi:hypothetical protein
MAPKRAGARSRAPAKPQALSFGAIVLVPFPFTSQLRPTPAIMGLS